MLYGNVRQGFSLGVTQQEIDIALRLHERWTRGREQRTRDNPCTFLEGSDDTVFNIWFYWTNRMMSFGPFTPTKHPGGVRCSWTVLTFGTFVTYRSLIYMSILECNFILECIPKMDLRLYNVRNGLGDCFTFCYQNTLFLTFLEGTRISPWPILRHA